MFKKSALLTVSILVIAASVAVFSRNPSSFNELTTPTSGANAADSTGREVVVPQGATYAALMASAGIPSETAMEIFKAASATYDLTNIRAGRTFTLVDDLTEGLQVLHYDIDGEDELIVSLRAEGIWSAVRQPIPYIVKERTVHGTVSETLYQAALDNGLDDRIVIEFADSLQWSVDFSQDVRAGDSFALVYEERFLNGKEAAPGRVLAGTYRNAGTPSYAFAYTPASGDFQYYDEAGNSVRKLFLKAPVSYRYISSGFTTGRRYVRAFNVSTGHRAIDYAAAHGTPIRAVGDGTVTLAGWDGSYGNKVSIRHNTTFSTNYAHMSKFAVKRGAKVSQGDVIGYVGSTGFSTGPHVHYELVKNGVKVNPLLEALPPGEPIAVSEREGFLIIVEKYKKALE